MENRFKMRISRMFRGSFGSCRTAVAGDLSDVVEKPPVFIPQPQNESYLRLTTTDDHHHHHHRSSTTPSINSPPPPIKPRPNFSSICRPKFPKTTSDSIFPRQKISGHRFPPFISAKHDFPPLHHDSQLNPFYKKRNKNKKSKNRNQKKTFARRANVFSSFSSQDSAYFNGNYWFSSEDELDEDEETLFSSRSNTLSSDSSGSGGFRTNRRRKKYSSDRRRKTAGEKKKNNVGTTVLPLDHHHGKVKDSFAVVKRSSDPYSDFRESMVEMIVEKQIFAAYDLEKLLQCFLSLNSDHHHRIILEVFTEIYEALFS